MNACMDITRPTQPHTWPYVGRFNTEKMVSSCKLHVRWVLSTNNGGCLSNLHPKATLLSISLYSFSASLVIVRPPEPRVST